MTNTAVYMPKNLLALHRQGPHGSASNATIVTKKNGALIFRRCSLTMQYQQNRVIQTRAPECMSVVEESSNTVNFESVSVTWDLVQSVVTAKVK